MNQRGRKGQTSLSVATPVKNIPRVAPPSELSEFEAHVWTAVVNTKPADWFQADTLPLLKSYCKHVSQAETLDREISEFDPEWLKSEDGLKRYKMLTDMRERESRAQTALARSMRLTHQSRHDAKEAYRKAEKHPVDRPWEK